jgi:multiple sugar transport system permease protein
VWLFTPTWEHFEYVLAQGFVSSLATSFIVASASTVLVVIIGTPAAYAFARFEMWRRDDLFLFILATRMAPPVCLVIPFYLIFARVGLLDTYTGLILAYLTFNLSFYVWVLRSFCRDLPPEIEEAAMVEGYSRIQALTRYVLPLLRPGIISTAVLCFIFAWNEFLFAFMLGGTNVTTLPVAIPTLITTQGVKWGEMAVVGIIALLPVLVPVFLLQRHIVRGLTMGAVKG